MKTAVVTVIYFIVIAISNTNADFKLDSILKGLEVSIGSYNSTAAVGNLTKKYGRLEPADAQASKYAAELLELLRRMFSVGIFALPPLDPYTSNRLKPLILGSDAFLSGKVFLKSLKIVGAKHFEVKSLEMRMNTGRFDFEIYFPKLTINVDFKTELYLSELIPLATSGEICVQIHELLVTGALQIEEKIRKRHKRPVYQVSGASFNLRANDIKVKLVNGLHLENDLVKTIYESDEYESFSKWISATKDFVNKYAVITFLSQANEVLRSISVAQVKAFLLPEDKKHS